MFALHRLLKNFFLRFALSTNANVAIMFALSAPIIFMAIGGGLELARAYEATQQLTEVANLACQYASRPSIVQNATSANSATYVAAVDNFITSSLAAQEFPLAQTTSTPFSFVPNGAANVQLSSSMPTVFAGIVHVSTIPISASAHCYDSPSSINQIVPNGASNIITQEGFEATSQCSNVTCWYLADGSVKPYCTGCSIPETQSQSAAPSYTGSHGTQWYVIGYCVETNLVGQVLSSVPEGVRSAELDCDNGSGTAGNSSISTSVYMAAGSYELRYNYAGRIDYPNYDPAYLCGTTASDLSWANETKTAHSAHVLSGLRTNQINVYLDPNTSGTIPLHTTIDGTQHLGGSDLIDMCVYSKGWIQRSVRINITTAGFYWLSFAADGQSDSYGGQLDNIMLCADTCSGSVQDNFPSAWASNTVLFEDTFESPDYVTGNNGGGYYNTNGNMGLSDGSSGASSGWPSQSASGWANAPTNQLAYWLRGCPQGTQCIELGWGSNNSLVSRPFLLDPGYYAIQYNYVSEVTFSNLSGAYCGATPSAAGIPSLSAQTGTGINRVMGVNHGTLWEDTNTVGVFMSHAQLASTANASTTLGATLTYTNPDGSVTTTPTNPPNSINLLSYNPAQANPLIDICGYASAAQARTVYVMIQKPAYYWLTFAALGSADGFGGQIDDVKLIAIGSLYGSAPSGAVTVPVPAPAAGSTYTNSGAFSGFAIVADPLTAPAP